MSVVISMLIGSTNSSISLVNRSVNSIIKNIGTENYLLVIGVARHIPLKIHHVVDNLSKINKKIIILKNNCESFARFINYVFSNCNKKSKWFLIAHDDVELKTDNFLPKVEETLKPFKENIGWISFTDDDYLNGHWAPSTRPGFHFDFANENAWYERKMFQFHNFDGSYDFPKAPVKCHAPFSHFIMIETKKLNELGPCEDWSPVSLLIDEDWGLTAMLKGMVNIWIPDIIYNHNRSNGSTRAQPIINRLGRKVHKKFLLKWGYSIRWPLWRSIKIVKERYGNTNIAWSINRKSFDWDYVK